MFYTSFTLITFYGDNKYYLSVILMQNNNKCAKSVSSIRHKDENQIKFGVFKEANFSQTKLKRLEFYVFMESKKLQTQTN